MAPKSVNVLGLGRSPVHTVILLAWPAIIEQIMLTLVGYVDTAMVGAIGAQATAAVGVTTSTMWLINGLFSAFGVGFSVQVAQCIGAEDYEGCRQAIRQSVLSVLGFGALTTLVCQLIGGQLPLWLGAPPEVAREAGAYFRILTSVMVLHMGSAVFSAILRCSGDTKTPMLLNILTNVMNIILNTLFIFEPSVHHTPFGSFTLPGLGMGVRGAAIASAISMGTVGLLLLLTTFLRKGEAHIDFHQNWRPDPLVWRLALRFGLPVAFERVTVSCGQIIFTMMVTHLGTVALAAHTLANTAESISYLPAVGISFAATTLVGQAKGAENRDMAFQFGKIVTKMGIVMGVVMFALLFFGARGLVGIFTRDLAVIALGAGALRIEALVQPLQNCEIVLAGAMRGGGDARFQFYVGLVCMWGVRLPVAFLMAFVFDLGLYGIWCGMAADIAMRGVLNLWRFYSGRWYGALH
ncbi:MAG: MATE family efflux transporter [Clostridiales bacterium]|uniref:MATE family efflux transporter n=1 Tax=Provencibacterium massiliense TaxID=1841868 RepID=UPI0009A73600|nr:MATE family efflux transporter [Provencibacterium massiliense]PWM36609.1 MAG: MATE family efflux transporter [Clostridiales bacterium]